MASFKVGDRVRHLHSSWAGVVAGPVTDGLCDVEWDDGVVSRLGVADIFAATPVNPRPIQPGDYIKDPGARPVDAEPLRVGELCYGIASEQVFCVESIVPHERQAEALLDDGTLAGTVRFLSVLRRLPPDAVLDVKRSPKRDGMVAFAEAVASAPKLRIAFVPVTLETATGLDLDWLARDLTGATRDNGETDEAYRNRCLKYRASMVKRMAPPEDAHRALLTRALALVSGLNLQHHAVTREQFETAQALCRDLVKVLKPGRG